MLLALTEDNVCFWHGGAVDTRKGDLSGDAPARLLYSREQSLSRKAPVNQVSPAPHLGHSESKNTITWEAANDHD
jgi:hypothetical protein